MPRKPRDIDAEIKALQDKAKELKTRQKTQFGQLVLATGADAFTADELAGVLLAACDQAKADTAAREGWRRRGEAFFQRGNSTRADTATISNGTAATPRHHPNGDQPTLPGSPAE